jgi:hypothetical protein
LNHIYVLTLATTTTARVANSSTSWTLTLTKGGAVIASGVSADDPHGDRARVDGREAARKHASSLGHRFTSSDVQVVYGDRHPPAAPPPASEPPRS